MRTLEENQRQQEAARRFNAAMATAPTSEAIAAVEKHVDGGSLWMREDGSALLVTYERKKPVNETAEQFAVDGPEGDEPPTRSRLDSELRVLNTILKALDELAPDAKGRAIRWLSDRFTSPPSPL